MSGSTKYLFILVALLLTACSHPSVPSASQLAGRLPQLQPDYVDVTIPVNLCPLNFGVMEDCDRVVARLSCGNLSYTYGNGKVVDIDADEWKELTHEAQDGDIKVEIWTRQHDGNWLQYEPFAIHVSAYEIDSYLTYRLIPPSYVAYEEIIIEQRDLTSFDTREIYNTRKVIDNEHGQCINCHSFQNYRTDRWLFHARKDWGGTIISDHGRIRKVDLKRPETISAGVYPAWHPELNLVAFSTNKTAQLFHTKDLGKIEVFDAASDLILYDPETDEVTTISNREDQLECFPTWSPDGKWLYYTSANVPFDIHAADPTQEAMIRYDSIRYDLCRKSFDPVTRQWGETEMVYEASADSMSVSLPRLSPDGHRLVFAMGSWGCFHVWHADADIYMIDVDSIPAKTEALENISETPETVGKKSVRPHPLKALNSDRSESYPTFSSNGHWVMTASRRVDGNYTRPYIAHFDPATGQCAKPFEVPQHSPAFYDRGFKSFNRPEFTIEPIRNNCNDIAHAILNQ